MKNIKSLVLFVVILNYCSSASPQDFTAGYYGGINISDIQGNAISGKWKFKPGPAQGIYFDYSFNRIFGLRTGIKYYTLYYEHLNGYQAVPWSYSSSYMPLPYYPGNEKMDFSFISFPAQVRLSIPSLPGLDLMAGIYGAFMTDYSGNYPQEFLKPPKTDIGYIYSAGFTIPLTERLKATIISDYTTGRKRILDYSGTHNGSIDFNLGIAWKGFLKDNRDDINMAHKDSASEKVFLIYQGGVNVSWNSCEKNEEKYSLNAGPSIGFLTNFRLSENSSFRTGLLFDRSGYSLKDSSDSFQRYYIRDDAQYFVDIKTSIDYLKIPILLSFDIGRSNRFFFNTGPYIDIRLNARCKGTAYYKTGNQGSYNLYERIVYDDLASAIKQYDFGWIFGGGVTFTVSEKIVIESGLQYRKGFRDVYKEAYLTEGIPYEKAFSIIENSSVSFQVGLRVPVFR